ncbi:MAG: TonB-dependent receptor [Candidatus Nitronauta litoralis]|uniref:TonB-dependent receptor n=1 Tax=Candidatus Nitronauta litoralis TaxID=2705533 RepID=A0A7T0BU03_9BACT|nr:MAG: TonB-dependent receptor [Candidatus Nitronauta litoralis]
MNNLSRLPVLAVFTVALLGASTDLILAAENNTTIQLKEVQVIADKEKIKSTLTVPSNQDALKEIQSTPGGANIVAEEKFEKKYTQSFADTLALTPGVYAQKRFGEEVRFSMRGSGLSRGFHMLGIKLLQDGIPFNLADGSGDFQESDFLAQQRIEVYKGGNSLQYGGTALGGTVNMITKNGISHPGQQVRLETGSDDTFRFHLQTGHEFESSDLFLSLSGTTSDDFRDHSEQENIKFNGNFGLRLSDQVESRFYFTTNIISQELPGEIPINTVLTLPETANPDAILSDWQRDINSVRLANKTTFDLGNGRFVDVGAFINHKNLFHPITRFVGVIDQESVDFGFFAQGYGSYNIGQFENNFRAGFTTQFGHTNALLFSNIGGQRGALRSDQDQYAQTAVIYGENHFFVIPELALITGGQIVVAGREADNNLMPARSDSETYATFNPRVGLLYQHSDSIQFFANITRSYEPPDFINLTQAGTMGFIPLDAQRAWTGEIGTRGQYGPVSWDLVFYRAWLDDELLQFATGPGIPASTFNADDTIHQGIEVGLNFMLGQNLLMGGDSLRWSNAYTFSDFYFDGDVQYGNNTIAGQPPHFFQTELRYEHKNGWYIAPNAEVASSAFVDFSNTLKAPDYAIMGFTAGYRVNENIDLFVSGRNLLDEEYAATFSTIASPNPFNTSTFFPGDDRRLFGGVTVNF